jgi:hypothetical protein
MARYQGGENNKNPNTMVAAPEPEVGQALHGVESGVFRRQTVQVDATPERMYWPGMMGWIAPQSRPILGIASLRGRQL